MEYLLSGKNRPSGKTHKFFERFLDNDLNDLSSFLQDQYSQIENLTMKGVTEVVKSDYWKESGSVSTIKWRDYNVFQFYHPGIYNLYKELSSVIKEACSYYEIDFDKQNYMVQGWFNINYAKVGKLDWHDHGGPYAPYFHGFYSVKAEPSITYYKVFGKETENHNIDNRMIVSEMGHPHAMGSWDWEGPRITIAYDIMPLSSIIEAKANPQHWIPLL
jgi:hypothetical protein